MDFFPIFLDLKKRPCLVVGGGSIAERKTALLLRSGAEVTLISPDLCHNLTTWRDMGRYTHLERAFRDEDLNGQHLAIAATNDPAVNRRVAEIAESLRIPVNVVDQPALCSFIVPSIIDRSPVVAAVSTGGASPVLARLIRSRLESLIPAGYGRLAELCNRFRQRVKERFAEPDERRLFWDRVLQGGVAERIFSGHEDEADQLMEQVLSTPLAKQKMGEVYLVGAGPGDPDLLTFRALRLMQQADVVIYDRLVAKPILDMTRHDAEHIYVGKERDKHTMRQEEINQLLAKLAKQGKRVLRLKGGDPFIFGRGGEEIDTLAAEGVPFQVIPGITAASGCASYAGIPLTHRDYAQSVTFVTGHLKDGTMNLNWKMLAQPNQTIVFYMGLVGLPVICRELKRHDVDGDMPIALIQQGTTQMQRVFTGTLETILDLVERERPKPPTLIIVGRVVELQEKLAWYEAPPHSEQGATSPIDY
ncbi:MAG: uroporphyrinogen-III C-methyltransferase [gamma proteobacterium symbiont of Ctena orbiculata]|uniref:Siroheme synthase n=1 Tax=Candidatus Thiodiazotropha taylori TaxID=2792791 RepID=A0A944QT93_9GAMM|nr:siroheme synthase CysG [Candidatus Thiodiazotropha taylori]PUB88105.1 MAG: uroporphyrinogen-III C-methyltransferase [gamma proteobacterium symbiont of Ctena orbiculata]MBT3025973.1 siroheme synthase CysG [Candidatus Thiodiazotropha taylori]MBT3033554.1 siroheme synthase CysG [Candidatus Thiodiazotropha taylori]MBV2135786.1 siroheme synthase CysG [Candidatus Thiodiazotropha taylori]